MSEPPTAYGVLYTPAIAKVPTFGHVGIAKLVERGIRYIRFQWNDYTNTTRFRVIPINAFGDILAAARPGVGITKAVFGLVGIGLVPGFSGTGEYLYVPDMASLRPCGYAPTHASVMGWFEEKTPVNGGAVPAVYRTPLCPRTLLRGIVDKARAAGLEFLVGIETEFILLESTDPMKAVNDYPWSTSAALPSGSDVTACLEEIAEMLQLAGIDLLMYHAEAAPGQYEVVTGPLPPLEAADALLATRETIFNIAAKYGFRATLAPRVFADNCGSAAHAHISVHRTAFPATHPPPPNPDTNHATTMTPLERSFLQALLAHLPALAALTLPTRASYARVQDGVWSGGTFACWGTENREALVRLTGAPGHHHFELRALDGTASPYLALAGILGAGLQGVLDGAELAVLEAEGPAIELSEGERKRRGIVGRMPRTLPDARELLRQDAVLHEVLGQEFVEKYLAVNETLEKHLSAETPEEEMEKIVLNY
ncbi:glutamine synthetase/guanido kinase [Auriscalpium vulgare]|uniref:Glutamine synthetase/guanido kinase n=1 Tax=Auriscalpium vulgare TaxID=40419 RepID=A0ACB8R7U6_9AGAM|nr:glutamine synthetase/guanido kinase [Auriscalpium vulgare]